MNDQNQPTPEQRAAWRNALTVLPDDGLGVVANEAIPALDAEVDRLTAALSDRDEQARLNAEEHLDTLRQLADAREDHDRGRAPRAHSVGAVDWRHRKTPPPPRAGRSKGEH